MPNALAISITAADRATRVIQKLNNRVEQMTRPFQNMRRSIQGFARAAGFDAVKKKLQGLAQTARGVVSAFSRIGAPLLALVGGGTIAGLLALTDGWARFGLQLSNTARILGVNTQDLYNFQNAAQLLGISGQEATQTFSSFADTLQDARWGRNQQAMGLLIGLGIQLKKTSSGSIDAMDALGQVADKIQAFQQSGNTGAARTLASQLGLTALLPVLMQGRKALEDYEAQAQKLTGVMDWRQAAAAAMQWNRLHVSMDGVKNSIANALLPTITPLVEQFGTWISTNRKLIATDISDFIKGMGAAFKGITLKDVLDDILALVQGLLNLGREISHVVGELGGIKTILEVLAGAWVVGKVIEFGMAFVKIAAWINGARKALIAWQLASAAGKGAAIAEGAAAAGSGGAAAAEGAVAGTVAKRFLPKALVATAGIGADFIPAIATGALVNQLWNGKIGSIDYNSWAGLRSSMGLNKIVASPVAPSVMQYFERQGWTPAQAAGITANIQAESNFDPNALGDHGHARGIGQWHADRQAAFEAWAKQNQKRDLAHADLPEQLEYYDYELKHSKAGEKLKGATNAFDAGSIVSLYDERPANGNEEASRRGAIAEQLAAQPPATPAPINVSVKTLVQKDGATTTTVQTPAGVKIVHTNPADSVT